MKLILKMFGRILPLSGHVKKEKVIVDLTQEALNKFGGEQLKSLMERGLRLPIVAV